MKVSLTSNYVLMVDLGMGNKILRQILLKNVAIRWQSSFKVQKSLYKHWPLYLWKDPLSISPALVHSFLPKL